MADCLTREVFYNLERMLSSSDLETVELAKSLIFPKLKTASTEDTYLYKVLLTGVMIKVSAFEEFEADILKLAAIKISFEEMLYESISELAKCLILEKIAESKYKMNVKILSTHD